MQLHDAPLFIPEQVFDKAHLLPVWTTPRGRNSDMLQARMDKCSYLEFTPAGPLYKEHTARS
ncbi:hypothetical protein XH84_14925 [Bradyrhizobium nanningense]|nr:hypothetical protein XH84_14925 [Bradyrhizobium nanningense]